MRNEQTVAALMAERALAEVVGYETDEVALTAAGSSIATYRGNTYIDFTSGIAVNALGHNHPDVIKAIVGQCRKITHVSDTMRHTPQLELASWMRHLFHKVVPGPDWSVLFMNSGSESTDAAAKLALKVTGRSQFIAFDGAFHGRTLFGTALSHSKSVQWQAYEPLLQSLRAAIHHAASPAQPDCGSAFKGLIDVFGNSVAAVFLEPMQGEGGYRPFPPETARLIRRWTHERGIMLVVDEVQSGWGRSGRWFGFEHLEIEPDIVVFGKAVGGGLPLAGIAAPHELMERWEPGEHGTTFGGNPLACAAGLAALKVIEREGLVERAAGRGKELMDRLAPLVGRHGIADVRGLGLMIGIELRKVDDTPDYARCEAVKRIARDEGLLVLTCGARLGKPGTDNATIRLIPALNAPDDVIDRGMEILVDAIVSAK